MPFIQGIISRYILMFISQKQKDNIFFSTSPYTNKTTYFI